MNKQIDEEDVVERNKEPQIIGPVIGVYWTALSRV